MPLKQTFSAGKVAFLLPWIFVVIVAVFAWNFIHRIDILTFRERSEDAEKYVTVSALNRCLSELPDDTPLTPVVVKTCLEKAKGTPQALDEAVKSRIDELKWILTVIASIGAFFAIAQGAAAWFSAQIYEKQAKAGLKKIDKAVDSVRSKYPLFEEVEQKRHDAFEALSKVFEEVSKTSDTNAGSTEALDWKDNLYRKLGVDQRQLLLSVESFVSIDLHPGKFAREKYADMLRKVALFYRSKFQFEDGLGYGSYCDLERGEEYLQIANARSSDFTMKNDLGSLYLTLYGAMKKNTSESAKKETTRALTSAEEAFHTSLKIEPKQQRAWYNLAIISARYRKDYLGAIELLTKSLAYDSWQRGASVYMKSILHYNIACYHSRELQQRAEARTLTTPVRPVDAAEVLDHLRQSADLGLVRVDIVKGDFATPGSAEETAGSDITGLISIGDQELIAKLAEIKAELIAKAPQTTETPQEPRRLREVLFEVYRLIKTRLSGMR